MGLTDYDSFSNAQTIIDFKLEFSNISNNSYGLYMPLSTPRANPSFKPMDRYGFTLFYIMKGNCPAGYFYNFSA